MLSLNIHGLAFLNLAGYFVLYSFLGWIMETAYAAWDEGHFVNRGFLNGPFCPVYGFGMVSLVVAMQPFLDNLPLLFLGVVVLTSVLEYITGWFLELIFHHKWWDYSNRRFNVQGRICLRFSLYWGFGGILLLKVVHPRIEELVNRIPADIGTGLLAAAALYLTADLIHTLVSLASLKSRLAEMHHFAQEARETLELLKYSSQEVMEERLEELRARYHHLWDRLSLGGDRLMKAFPNLRKLRLDYRLKDLLDNFEKSSRHANR
ncbi:MAG: putative ABC transporter permease [Syntrophomonadaceae bacterium]